MCPDKSIASESLLQEIEVLRKQLQQYQEFDSITGLYNKDTFYKKVREALSQKASTPVIICIDIERFKVINDLYGTEEGDKLLKYFGEKVLQVTTANTGLAARITADVFALFFPSLTFSMKNLEKTVLDWLKQYPLNMEITPAIGIYPITDPSIAVNLMCDRAILALNSIKGSYLKHIAEYRPGMRTTLIEEQELISGAEKALSNREFRIYIQPKCDLKSGKLIGSEALVRWDHPKKGLLAPCVFIPLFEKNGFIQKLDAYLWEEICILLRNWIDHGNRAIPISVNVSRVDLYNENLCGILLGLMQKYALEPSLLELEITESAYAENLEQMLSVVNVLRKNGFTVLMDDFGSGYSSLNMLKDINVDILKIDLRFLENKNQEKQRGGNIMESVVRMAKWLNMHVIAEGVETRQQIDFLLSIGCYYAQGYYFYKPMLPDDFEQLLSDETKIDYNRIQDISNRAIRIEDLFQSDIMSNILLNNILGGVALYEYSNGTLEVLRVNDGYYQITGWSPEILCKYGKQVFDSIYKPDRPIVDNAIRKAKDYQSQGVEIQFRRIRPDGKLIWMHMRLFFLAENNGKEIYYASINDITKQKESEDQLRLSEKRLRLAMESSSIFLYDFNIEKREISFSEQQVKRYGRQSPVKNIPEGPIADQTVYPDDTDRYRAMYQAILNGQEKASCDIRLRVADGSYIWNRITLMAVHTDTGYSPVALGMVENITKEKELELRLIEDEKSLLNLQAENQRTAISLINETFPGGIIGGYCEPGFPLYVINREMLWLLGYDSQEDFMQSAEGLVLHTIHPDDRDYVANALGDLQQQGHEYTVKYRMVRKDGSYFWTIDKGRIVKAEDGRLAIISVCIDISEQEELRNELNTVLDNTVGDIVSFHIKDGIAQSRFYSNGLYKAVGYNKQEYQNILQNRNGKDLTHPADHQKIMDSFWSAVSEKQPVDFNFRTIHQDGTVGWTNLKAAYYGEEDGYTIYYGVYTDITQLRQKEEKLFLSDKRFRLAIGMLKVDIWEYDYTTRCLLRPTVYNDFIAAPELLEDVPQSIIQQKLVHPDSVKVYRKMFDAIKKGSDKSACEVRILCRDGLYHWFRITSAVIQRLEDNTLQIIGVTENIDSEKAQQQSYNKLLMDSQSDFLTGLYNREAFQTRIEASLQKPVKEGYTAAFLLFDIDNFKHINDRFGHIKGDEILREIGALTFRLFGDGVTAGRLGGDEFAVYVEEAGYESDICKAAQTLCDQLNAIQIGDDCKQTISASIGIAFVTEQTAGFQELYKKADTALYQVKSTGKNTYSVYSHKDAYKKHPYFNLDTMLLDELDGFVYIIDYETYDLIYCNTALMKQFGIDSSYKFQKCYKLLRGFDSPCPGCKHRKLSYDHFTVRDYYDVQRKLLLELKGKLVQWHGYDLRLEIARIKNNT